MKTRFSTFDSTSVSAPATGTNARALKSTNPRTDTTPATFLIASPFPSQLPPASHFLRSLLALNPAVPPDHLLSIDRQKKGFFRGRARTAKRFPVRWNKKIESGIAPPQLPGWDCDRLEGENIDVVRRIYSFIRRLSNTVRRCSHITRIFPYEPLFRHSGRFHEKRDLGGKPKSLLELRWCRRRDLTDEAPANQACALPAGSPA